MGKKGAKQELSTAKKVEVYVEVQGIEAELHKQGPRWPVLLSFCAQLSVQRKWGHQSETEMTTQKPKAVKATLTPEHLVLRCLHDDIPQDGQLLAHPLHGQGSRVPTGHTCLLLVGEMGWRWLGALQWSRRGLSDSGTWGVSPSSVPSIDLGLLPSAGTDGWCPVSPRNAPPPTDLGAHS